MPVYQKKDKNGKIVKDAKGNSWCYRCYYTNIYGVRTQRRSKLYFTKAQAQEEERKFLLKSSEKEIEISNLYFKDLINNFFKWKKGKVRTSSYERYIGLSEYLNYLHKIKVSDFNINTFEMWKEEINRSKLNTSSKNDIFTLFKMILNYGSDYLNLNFDKVYRKMTPFTNPDELKKEMNFYTYEEYKAFINNEEDDYFRLLYDVLYFLGLRIGELRGLQWKYVDYERKTIKIKYQIPTNQKVNELKLAPLKTKTSERELPLTDSLIYELKKHQEEEMKYENYSPDWFIFGGGVPISKETIKLRKNKLCKQANLKQIRIQDFRHSCASLLINNNASITLVSKYLGHSSITTTLNIYAHMFKNQLEGIINVINKLEIEVK